jgi:starch-binding outer membrane protein, SusD/RagB family
MKKFRFLLSLLAIAAFSSCEEYLDENNIGNVTASGYYTTAAGLEDAVRATYGIMKEFYGPEIGWTMTVFGTDTYRAGADGSHKYMGRYDSGHNSEASYMRDTWRIFYRQVNQANAVIARAENVEDMDATLKGQRIAEAKFLRALAYFNLVRHYGDIHLTLEETEGVEIEANKTSAADVYAAIVSDLTAAIAGLEDNPSNYGRASIPAAQFLMAKVKLSQPSPDAAAAEAMMTAVINNPRFSMLADFSDLWTLGNENNSEVVWSIQNAKSQVDEGLDGYGHRGHLYFLMEYDKKPAMTRDTENGRPWKRFRPTEYLMDVVFADRQNDSRYDKTFKHVWYANVGNDGGPNGVPVAVGDTALYIPGPGLDRHGVDQDGYWTAAKQASVNYEVYTSDEWDTRTFPSLNKWIDNSRPNRQHTQGQRDFLLMRLADAYLIRAEARLAQGNSAGAAADINVIRTRAAWDDTKVAAMQITADQVDIDLILDERARELVGEGHRWYDLKRTGQLISRVRAHNSDARDNIQSHHVVRPIPLEQIDRTSGGYAQNPGYAQ